MRFCTTHRACEVDYGGICEVSACGGYWADAPCTLVDALIVPKVDGEWPAWATEITIPPEPVNHPMRRSTDLKPLYVVFDGHKILDALAQSKEAP